MEEWKDIEGFEGCYQISTHGRVRSLDREIVTSNGRRRFYKGDIKQTRIAGNTDYVFVILYKGKYQKTYTIHRLVGNAFIPNLKNKPTVDHKDGNKMNNHVSNLRWFTP